MMRPQRRHTYSSFQAATGSISYQHRRTGKAVALRLVAADTRPSVFVAWIMGYHLWDGRWERHGWGYSLPLGVVQTIARLPRVSRPQSRCPAFGVAAVYPRALSSLNPPEPPPPPISLRAGIHNSSPRQCASRVYPQDPGLRAGKPIQPERQPPELRACNGSALLHGASSSRAMPQTDSSHVLSIQGIWRIRAAIAARLAGCSSDHRAMST